MQSPKNILIKKSDEIIKLIQEINSKPCQNFEDKMQSMDFECDIVPNYKSAVFKLRNYSQLKQNQEIVYSDHLQAYGITWRLKVYPNGNGASKG